MPELDQRVPELNAGVDIRTLPLSALDGFVLSRIDGRTRVSEIVSLTGLSGPQVLEILRRLVELGAVRLELGGGASSAPPRPPAGTGHMPVTGRPPSLTPSGAPRRRNSILAGSVPKRVFSESSISGPPPDVRSVPPRARVSTPARPYTPVPPSTRPRTPAPPSGAARRASVPPPESIPVTLPPLSLPPLSSPLLMSPPPAAPSIDQPSFESEATAARPQAPLSSLNAPAPIVTKSPYDAKELDEEVDLPRERRKQVLDLFYRLQDIDYYELLGVAQNADKKEIRAAYFALSKAFHPDSMFRKELGSFKAKMVAVFQASTEAYETLGRKKTREEYDAYLRSTRAVQQAERTLATEEVAQADTKVEVPRPPPLPTTDYDLPPPPPIPATQPSIPPREASEDAKRIARELIAKRLRGLPQRAPQPVVTASANPPPPPTMDRQQLAKDLGRALMDAGKLTGSTDKVARAVQGSKAAFERGDVAASVQHMARAFSLAPERVDLHQEYERLQQLLAHQLASNYEGQAKFEMKQSKFGNAAVSWQKVCEGKPNDADAHRNAAFCMLKAGGDQRSAQKYAQKAVYLAPNDIDARVLLAQTYLTVGLKLNAKRELDAAAKLDPANEVVKNLLSDLAK